MSQEGVRSLRKSAWLAAHMSGRWSLVRLFKEAHMDSELECARWCIKIGLLPNAAECRLHKSRMILNDDGRNKLTSVYWTCQECNAYRSVTKGTIFENSRLHLRKALVAIHCFANKMTLEDTRRNCIFKKKDPFIRKSTLNKLFDKLRDVVAFATKLKTDNGNCTPLDGFVNLIWRIIVVQEARIRNHDCRGQVIIKTI